MNGPAPSVQEVLLYPVGRPIIRLASDNRNAMIAENKSSNVRDTDLFEFGNGQLTL